jgi:hypothetical protein
VLSDVRPQVQWGEDAERIVARATASADRLVQKLLVESIRSWATTDFDRYDDREISFTIRLFSRMQGVKASNRGEMVLIHLQYDGPLPTREMLLGVADAGRTPRPDLTVKCGEASIHIEAKKLMPAGGLPAKYVNDGMMRFINGRYVSAGTSLALMLGYIMQGLPGDCYEAINEVIRVHPQLGPEEVTKQREIVEDIAIYFSEHRAIGEITHYAVDVRRRGPSFLQSESVVAE